MKEMKKNNQLLGSDEGMSGTAIQEIITRAVQDKEFKELLINNADEALKGYELSEMQSILIKSLDDGRVLCSRFSCIYSRYGCSVRNRGGNRR